MCWIKKGVESEMGSRTAQNCVTGVGIERYIGIYRAGKRK